MHVEAVEMQMWGSLGREDTRWAQTELPKDGALSFKAQRSTPYKQQQTYSRATIN